jgi:DNA topoisomerase-1
LESPGKTEKVAKALGPEYLVMASRGHVRDLPEKEIGVEPPLFQPKYVPTAKGQGTLSQLAAAVRKADTVFLATDPDREGEAIAWHLAEALKLRAHKRITFNEITAPAIKNAVAQPRSINMDLVRAQECRRVLDRLVGYPVSVEVSRVGGRKLSAGRVQSPALRLVVEREEAIKNFKGATHFGVEYTFESVENIKDGWKGQWDSKSWLEPGQDLFLDRDVAERLAALKTFTVSSYQESDNHRQAPPPPFTTSSLQQAASNALKFSPQKTMELAQNLYTGGHISYLRTDSTALSQEAVDSIRSLASQNDWPVPAKVRTWKNKAEAQEAHEAIRSTHFEIEEAGDGPDEKALYELIRLRAIASQIEDAIYAVTEVTLEAELDGQKVAVKARGKRLISPGWRVAMARDQTEDAEDEGEPANNIPRLREGAELLAMSGRVLAKKTRPPARFTEASLVGKLEDLGLGRPATYAATLDKIIGNEYVKVEDRQLVPTPTGQLLMAIMAGKFSFLDYDFTKNLEQSLDDIAEGRNDFLAVIQEVHRKLAEEIKSFIAASGTPCPDCGCSLVKRVKEATADDAGYSLWFCSGHPNCSAVFADCGGKPGERRERRESAPLSEHVCRKCGKPLRHQVKEGPKGYNFWGCSGFPQCKETYEDDEGKPGEKRRPKGPPASGFKCRKCRGPLYRRQGTSGKTGLEYDFFACADRSCGETYPTKDGQPDFDSKKRGQK